jgi:hypothetical protein
MSNEQKKPDCYKCVHRMVVPGDCHSRCNNTTAKVKGNAHGIKNGWFHWPYNFDPVWLQYCDGSSDKQEDKKEQKGISLAELMSMLR